MSAPCNGAHASKVHAYCHQLTGAEVWAAHNSNSFSVTSFFHFLFYFFFLCIEVLEALPQLGLEPFGPLPSTL